MALAEAEMVVGLCQRFGVLPMAGGLLDQDATFIQQIHLYDMAHPPEAEV
jgi:hypothetical protein